MRIFAFALEKPYLIVGDLVVGDLVVANLTVGGLRVGGLTVAVGGLVI
jgi:hypothetical protein